MINSHFRALSFRNAFSQFGPTTPEFRCGHSDPKARKPVMFSIRPFTEGSLLTFLGEHRATVKSLYKECVRRG